MRTFGSDCEPDPIPIRQKTLSSLVAAIPAALLLILLVAIPARAQYRASIQGTVTDPTGAVISGATLTLTNDGTNEKQVRTSNGAGIYNFNALPPDTFTLVVEREGFQKKVLDHLQLIPEQANAINVVLEVGGSSSTITVNASTEPSIDRETADNGISITANEIQHLPAFERDVTQLVQLAPGVLADGSQAGGGGGFASPGTESNTSHGGGGNLGASSSIFATENGASANANGGQYENNGYTVDGISTASAVWGGATIITPSEDSVGNVNIVTNAYDAEQGRFNGAMTEITSKSGTNNLHGSLFVQVVRPGLNAYQRWNGPASVAPGAARPGLLLRDDDRYNQLGGSIGGPLWKNRLFAFFNYEGQNNNTVVTGTGWYLTSQLAPLAPSNSIASTFLNFPHANVLGTVTSASCKNAGLNEGVNCVTVNGGLNIGSPLTTGLHMQDLTYVDASHPGAGSGLSTTPDIALYSTSSPQSSDFKQYNGRLDADVTSKDHASFAIYWVPASTIRYNGGLGYDLFNHDQINDAFSVIWNHVFTPTFLNEARGNAAGWRYNELASNPQEPLGLPQINIDTIGNVNVGNLGPGYPAHDDQWTYGYKDVATKVVRTQTMKFGFDLTRLYYLNIPIGIPNYAFYNLWDFINDAPEAENGAFQATTGLPGGYRNDNRENMFGIFFQDNWKVTPNLTLTAGLRYSYFGPITDKDNNMGVLTFGAGTDLLTGITIRTGIDGWIAQKLNFGPELGFNWSPDALKNKLVLRGGFGLNYNGEQIANANNYDGNPPGTSSVPGTSTGPTNINPNIVYAVSTGIDNIFGFPPNKHAITTFNSAGLPTGGGANLGGLPGHLPTQYLEHFSLEAEYDLGHALIANLGYEAGLGRHEMYNYDATALADIMGAPQNPLITGINTFGSGGWSNNNMMLAGLKHQFSHTFSAEGQFTWAHSLDTNSGPYDRSAYLYNPGYSYGNSSFNINRSLKIFGVWQPVIFHGSYNWAEKIVGGWSISGILTLHSGYGWTPSYTEPHQIYCNTCNYGYQTLRPYYLGGAGKSSSNDAFKTGSNFPSPGMPTTGTPVTVSCSSAPIANYVFANNYFSVPNYYDAITDCSGQSTTTFIPAPGLDRNTFPGPGYRNVDATLAKSFGFPNTRLLGENTRLEIKANFFNILNLLNISPSSIATNIESSNLGQASAALGSRTVDFQARFSF